MAHFAKIENEIVVQVNVVDEQFFIENPEKYLGTWIQTSYNTHGGIHYNIKTGKPSSNQSKALRKNYASFGMIYDEVKDAFYTLQPYDSWTLNEKTCIWEAPTPYPNDGKGYDWNETNKEWTLSEPKL